MSKRGRPIKDFTKDDGEPFYCQSCGEKTGKIDEHWIRHDLITIRICKVCFKERDN
jgi:hypothetical protein